MAGETSRDDQSAIDVEAWLSDQRNRSREMLTDGDGAGETRQQAPGPSVADPLIGTHIGQYHIKNFVAAGGMGTVYLAIQKSPRRKVALKVMRRGIASASALRRFEFESQTLGRLRHPGIAQVYEAGTHDSGEGGVPYFAMEFIPNAKPITTFAIDSDLSTSAKVELFANLCDAVAHGHQKGIIHRDLKPSNILVDSWGQPKVIDFGVAKATDSDLAVTTVQTDLRQLIGTLQYMSPEQ
jgi:non-specific serine/threonine protein kinase/serine/threonine-protein kinase